LAEEPHPLQNLQRQIGAALDFFYDRIGRHHHPVSGQILSQPAAPADHAATENGLDFTLELPGVDPSDIDVVVQQNRLRIRSEKSERKSKSSRIMHRQERHYGRLERSFRLPPEVDTIAAHAEYRNGVLRITIPRKAGARKVREIPVKRRLSD
jgi:HSP20 family protein